jgi:hypothetical protein
MNSSMSDKAIGIMAMSFGIVFLTIYYFSPTTFPKLRPRMAYILAGVMIAGGAISYFVR